MKEAAIRKRLREICESMKAMPPSGPRKAPKDGVYYPQISTEARSTEDSLDELRLQVKYLLFDVEATRRENRYLRQMLDNHHRPRSDDSQNGLSDF